MSEIVLFLWLLIPGEMVTEPTEVGTYRSMEACEAEAKRHADDPNVAKDKRYAAIWRCIQRDK